MNAEEIAELLRKVLAGHPMVVTPIVDDSLTGCDRGLVTRMAVDGEITAKTQPVYLAVIGGLGCKISLHRPGGIGEEDLRPTVIDIYDYRHLFASGIGRSYVFPSGPGEVLSLLSDSEREQLCQTVLAAKDNKAVVESAWYSAPMGASLSKKIFESKFPAWDYAEYTKPKGLGYLHDGGRGAVPDLENIPEQTGQAIVAERQRLLEVLHELGSALHQYNPGLFDSIWYGGARPLAKYQG